MRVLTGAAVLAEGGFSELSDKRVGAIVNQTSLIDSTHVVDAMLAAGVDVVALFGPEHGVRGNAGAGVVIEDGRDTRTGLPVYSLYGANRRPSQEMLGDVDALVFDIQDVGARFYTYISTMGLAMQSAAEAGIPFYVLDRPNPLGGTYVSGFVLEEGFESFVGQYPIPVAHGLTVGELARMIAGEQWLDGLDALDLRVVEMQHWTRSMLWPATGLEWTPTSPNIPTFETAAVYPGMCFIEALNVAEGRGTPFPFLQTGALWLDADSFAESMSAHELAGIAITPTTFTPRSNPVAAPSPRLQDTEVYGVRLNVTDYAALDAVELGVAFLVEYVRSSPNFDELVREGSLRRLAGTDAMLEALQRGDSVDAITALWEDDVEGFRQQRVQYLLYAE